jgi:hypothetical protein
MSRPIFSCAAPVEVSVSSAPPPRAQHRGRHKLKPGQRLIDGRLFYSAAWLDQATSALSEPPALKRRGDAGLERSAGDDPSRDRAGGAPAGMPGLGG